MSTEDGVKIEFISDEFTLLHHLILSALLTSCDAAVLLQHTAQAAISKDDPFLISEALLLQN